MSTIDLSPILTPLIEIAGLVLTGFATWAINKAATYFHIQSQTALLARVNDIADRAISYAQQTVAAKVSSVDKINTQSAIVAEAANYLASKAPDSLAALGFTPQHVSDLILAKLPPAEIVAHVYDAKLPGRPPGSPAPGAVA